MEIFIWSTFYLCVVFAASLMVGVRRNSRTLKLLTLPGLLLYSGCRALGCLASCTPMERFGVLDDGEPFVKLGETRMAYVGNILGIVVTHAALVACFFFARSIVGIADWEDLCVPAFSAAVSHPPLLVDYLRGVWAVLPFDALSFWVTLYLCVAVCFSLELSMREFVAAVCVTIAGAWVCGLLIWLGVHVSFLSHGWWIVHFRLPEWLGVASFYLLAVTATAVVIAATLGWRHGSRSYQRQIVKTQPHVASREKQHA